MIFFPIFFVDEEEFGFISLTVFTKCRKLLPLFDYFQENSVSFFRGFIKMGGENQYIENRHKVGITLFGIPTLIFLFVCDDDAQQISCFLGFFQQTHIHTR